jgi:hypothetical protein
MTDQWTDRLSEYLDDELTARERRALESHLGMCEECRRVLGDLQLVLNRAAAVGNRPPERDLWPAIQARLQERRPSAPFWRAWLAGEAPRFSLTFAQLAVAAVALVVVAAGATWMVRGRLAAPANQVAVSGGSANTGSATPAPGPGDGSIVFANFADPQYDAAVADLQKALENGRERLDPRTIEIVEKNLTIIDQAIDQAREALKADPDPANTYLNSYVADARRRKLALLREATALADRSS